MTHERTNRTPMTTTQLQAAIQWWDSFDKELLLKILEIKNK